MSKSPEISMDDFLLDLEEDRPQDVHSTSQPPEVIPDEEDIEDLINDCYQMMELLVLVDLPREILLPIENLRARLESIQGWNTYH
jgi:hypothetical protein